jgi:hypothetical protein
LPSPTVAFPNVRSQAQDALWTQSPEPEAS